MPKYEVDVTVRFRYEVDADNATAAEEQGWKWEDYPMFGEVYDISVDELYEPQDD